MNSLSSVLYIANFFTAPIKKILMDFFSKKLRNICSDEIIYISNTFQKLFNILDVKEHVQDNKIYG